MQLEAGETPHTIPRHSLAYACQCAQPHAAEQLLLGGADVNGAPSNEPRPLHAAAAAGRLDCVRLLLEWQAEVDAKQHTDGSTAAWWASWRGHRGCLAALLDAGASANAATSDGASCLIMACGAGHAECVQLLIERGANVHHVALGLPSDAPGIRCPTALMTACAAGESAVVRLLLDAGADVSQLATAAASSVACDEHCAMSIACEMGYTDVVRLLLSRGAAINAIGHCLPPVLHACFCYCGAGSEPNPPPCSKAQLALELLERGADPHGRRCNLSCDMLALACMHGCLNCVKVLVAYGVSITEEHLNLDVRRYGTGAHRLERAYHVGVRSFLLGARRWRPLDHLETFGPERARALLRAGADLADVDPSSRAVPSLEMARQLDAKSLVVPGSGAEVVLQAAQPWSPSSHHLFPAAARRFAAEVLRMGYKLPMPGMLDIWIGHVMPKVVKRAASVRWGSQPRVAVAVRVCPSGGWDLFSDTAAHRGSEGSLVAVTVAPYPDSLGPSHPWRRHPLPERSPRQHSPKLSSQSSTLTSTDE